MKAASSNIYVQNVAEREYLLLKCSIHMECSCFLCLWERK